MDEIDFAASQIQAAQDYLLKVLERIDHDQWFITPPGCHSHIAWQVGHIAMARYRLGLLYVRPETPADRDVMPAGFIPPFTKGSVPTDDPAVYPSAQQIADVAQRVGRHLLEQLPAYRDIDLHTPALHPHRLVVTRFDALTWVARHEMLHIGQIGLIRRLLGCDIMW